MSGCLVDKNFLRRNAVTKVKSEYWFCSYDGERTHIKNGKIYLFSSLEIKPLVFSPLHLPPLEFKTLLSAYCITKDGEKKLLQTQWEDDSGSVVYHCGYNHYQKKIVIEIGNTHAIFEFA